MATKPGLYANIAAKKKRIAAGSGEKMRKVGAKGAPSAKDFKDAAKLLPSTLDSLKISLIRLECSFTEDSFFSI